MRVSEAMSRDVRLANPGQSIRDVAKIMAEIDAGAMPVQVVNREKRLVGIVSLGDVATNEKKAATKAVSGVSREGGPHSQGARI